MYGTNYTIYYLQTVVQIFSDPGTSYSINLQLYTRELRLAKFLLSGVFILSQTKQEPQIETKIRYLSNESDLTTYGINQEHKEKAHD
jgi:hypothetical protein